MTIKFAFAPLITLCYLYIIPVLAQENDHQLNPNFVDRDKLPVPNEKNQLFYLQRDPNANTIVYALNLIEGQLDEKKPIHAYWMRYEDDGKRAELSFFQRNMAYGIGHKLIDGDKGIYELKLAACKKLPLFLHYKPNKKAVVTVKTDDKTIAVEYIFVRINGGSKMNPNIEYIEVGGTDCETNSPVKKRISP